jgi:glycerophosphoryl diester phosphodiesterase
MKLSLKICLFTFFCFLSAKAQLMHSHNDYEQREPFEMAYRLGYDSIEADLFLKDGEIMVAHDWDRISPERTFQKLYLVPLLAKIKTNGGFVYSNKKPLFLLLDLKKDGKAILEQLFQMLKPYQQELKNVTIVISGDMPAPSDFKHYPKLFYFDGRRTLNYTAKELKRVAFVSASLLDFGKYWSGKNPLNAEIQNKIADFVLEFHQKKKKVRLWATPNTILGYETLQKLGVDMIGTDDLALLHSFINP